MLVFPPSPVKKFFNFVCLRCASWDQQHIFTSGHVRSNADERAFGERFAHHRTSCLPMLPHFGQCPTSRCIVGCSGSEVFWSEARFFIASVLWA